MNSTSCEILTEGKIQVNMFFKLLWKHGTLMETHYDIRKFVNFSKDGRIKLERVTKIQISCSAVSLSFFNLSN